MSCVFYRGWQRDFNTDAARLFRVFVNALGRRIFSNDALASGIRVNQLILGELQSLRAIVSASVSQPRSSQTRVASIRLSRGRTLPVFDTWKHERRNLSSGEITSMAIDSLDDRNVRSTKVKDVRSRKQASPPHAERSHRKILFWE